MLIDSGVELSHIDLSGFHFVPTDFSESKFLSAKFTRTELDHVKFDHSVLYGASMDNAVLDRVSMNHGFGAPTDFEGSFIMEGIISSSPEYGIGIQEKVDARNATFIITRILLSLDPTNYDGTCLVGVNFLDPDHPQDTPTFRMSSFRGVTIYGSSFGKCGPDGH
jgi:uncharacterized protein YjbI with pentapeptide repeats